MVNASVMSRRDLADKAAQTPPTFVDHGYCFGLAFEWDEDRIVGVSEVETSPALQVEQVIKMDRRRVFGLIEHYGPLPAPKAFRLRHAADVLFADHRSRRFVAGAIEAAIASQLPSKPEESK